MFQQKPSDYLHRAVLILSHIKEWISTAFSSVNIFIWPRQCTVSCITLLLKIQHFLNYLTESRGRPSLSFILNTKTLTKTAFCFTVIKLQVLPRHNYRWPITFVFEIETCAECTNLKTTLGSYLEQFKAQRREQVVKHNKVVHIFRPNFKICAKFWTKSKITSKWSCYICEKGATEVYVYVY